MKDFRELNQQVNEVKRMLNSFIQKLTAQVETVWKPGDLSFPCREGWRRKNQYMYYLILNTICVIFFVDTYYMCGINSLTLIFNSVLIGKPLANFKSIPTEF